MLPLSNSLDSIFDKPEEFYSDAKLVLANGHEVSFHRCILSARIPFFKTALARAEKIQVDKTTKLELKEIAKDYEVGFHSVITVLSYAYSNRIKPPPKEISNCLDMNCCHLNCRPTVNFFMEVLYLASIFQIPELVTRYQSQLLEIVDNIGTEHILDILALASICGEYCKTLSDECVRILAWSDLNMITLKKSLPFSSHHIVNKIADMRKEVGLDITEPERNVLGLYQALDTGDIELVKMFQSEGISLNDAYAIHYAVAYCEVKITMHLLELELVDVNQRNPKGYTALHVAVTRKEPNLIMCLLLKGAVVSETTSDGRTALQIARQLTKEADYNHIPEHGILSPKGRVCIELLEQAHKQVSWPVETSHSGLVALDELKTRLLCLENQVALARSLFPMETLVALDVGLVEGTHMFTVEDLKIEPFTFQQRYESRLRALLRSVKLVKCFFPRCWEVVDSLADSEDSSDLPLADEDTPSQRQQKAKRLMELQETLIEYIGNSFLPSLSSSTSKSTAAMRSSGRKYHRRQ